MSKKLSELVDDITINDEDYIYLVDPSLGTSGSKKVTVGEFKTAVAAGLAGIIPITTPPLVGTLTWVNKGNAEASNDTENGSILIADYDNSEVQSQRLLVHAAPSGHYTVTFVLVTPPFIRDYSRIGFAWRESTSGKVVVLQLMDSGMEIKLEKYLADYTWDSDYAYPYCPMYRFPFFIAKFEDDGSTDRIISLSNDGINFYEYFRIARDDYITPDQIGIAIEAYSADIHGSVISWSEHIIGGD